VVHGLDDERIPLRPVITIAGRKPDADGIAARHLAVETGRRTFGWRREAGLDVEGTQLHAGPRHGRLGRESGRLTGTLPKSANIGRLT
jgi:hypothetical protein